jgi:hypothetical protein
VCKLFLNPVLLGFFLTFGLSSCAKEKRQDDSFSVGTPEIRAIEARLLVTDSAVPGTTFSAQSFVEFPALKGHDFENEPVQFEAVSSCRGEKLKHQQKFEFKNTGQIRVQDLLPLSAFAPNADSSLLDCLVSFRARNRHGSTHTFTLPNLQVDLATTSEGLALQIDGRAVDASNNKISASEILKLRLLDPADDDVPRAQWVHLLCEGFHSTISDRAYRNYGFEKLLQAKAEGYDGIPFRDQKQQPKQNCRIVRETSRDVRMLEVSPKLQAQFEISLPTVKILTAFFPEGSIVRDSANFVTVEISNPHGFEIAIAIPNNEERAIHLRPAVTYDRGFVALPLRSSTVTWTTSSAKIYQDDHVIKLKIAPGEKVVLSGSARFEFYCQKKTGGFVPGGQNGQAGFFYDIPAHRLNFYVSATNTYEANNKLEGLELPLIPKPADENGIRPLPGWSPLPALRNSYAVGSTSEPKNVSTENLSTQNEAGLACHWWNL